MQPMQSMQPMKQIHLSETNETNARQSGGTQMQPTQNWYGGNITSLHAAIGSVATLAGISSVQL